MARTYVFLVHGVGKHPAGTWSEAWQAQIIEQLQLYAPYKGMSVQRIKDELLCFVEIGYDHVFEEFRDGWSDLAGALADNDVLAHPDVVDALRWVGAHGANDPVRQVFWDKILDALLWHALPLARARVIATVAEQVVQGVQKMQEENGAIDRGHCVAHSLGTSVLHDALVSLTHANDLHQYALHPAHFKWQSITMLANTSRLLKAWKNLSSSVDLADYHPYRSLLRPGSPGSATHNYFNVWHQIDPITWPRRFEPFDWDARSYLPVRIEHFREPLAVHDFEHYLRHPNVHLHLLRALLNKPGLGTIEEVRKVSADYVRAFPHTGDDALARFKRLVASTDERLSTKQLVEYLSVMHGSLG